MDGSRSLLGQPNFKVSQCLCLCLKMKRTEQEKDVLRIWSQALSLVHYSKQRRYEVGYTNTVNHHIRVCVNESVDHYFLCLSEMCFFFCLFFCVCQCKKHLIYANVLLNDCKDVKCCLEISAPYVKNKNLTCEYWSLCSLHECMFVYETELSRVII